VDIYKESRLLEESGSGKTMCILYDKYYTALKKNPRTHVNLKSTLKARADRDDVPPVSS
jgi:hypothetical protein